MMNQDINTPALSGLNITVSYQNKPILQGLNIEIPSGKITALCGPNGCGKTTLLKSLAGLQPLVQGEILLEGQPLCSFKRRTRARTLTMLSQFNQVPEGLKVVELVSYGRYAFSSLFFTSSTADQVAIANALEAMDLLAYANHEVAELSGGERQRAWIAMALAQGCKILLLDEPTTYLDPHHQLEVLRTLRQLNRDHGLTIVWVLHELNQAAAFSDHIVLMQLGRILHQGAPDEIIRPHYLEDTFGLPMIRLDHPESGDPVCLPSYRSDTRPHRKLAVEREVRGETELEVHEDSSTDSTKQCSSTVEFPKRPTEYLVSL